MIIAKDLEISGLSDEIAQIRPEIVKFKTENEELLE